MGIFAPMTNETDTIAFRVDDVMTTLKAPASWDDLDRRTALLFYNSLFTTDNRSVFADAFTAAKLISITADIIGRGPEFMPRWEIDCVMEDPELGSYVFLEELKQVMVVALHGLFEVLEDENGGTRWAVKFNRTKNLWPALVHKVGRDGRGQKVRWYYAPKDGLSNITLYEMIYTFSLYEAYVRTGEDRYVNLLIGAMYRPSRPETADERESAWHGDRRQPLRNYEDKVDERARLAATMPALTRRMIVFWFGSCRESIVRQYPKVFVRSEDAPQSDGYGWSGVLLRLAETGAFGALGETSDQHYSNAMTFLSMKEDERRRMEQELERAKNQRPRR